MMTEAEVDMIIAAAAIIATIMSHHPLMLQPAHPPCHDLMTAEEVAMGGITTTTGTADASNGNNAVMTMMKRIEAVAEKAGISLPDQINNRINPLNKDKATIRKEGMLLLQEHLLGRWKPPSRSRGEERTMPRIALGQHGSNHGQLSQERSVR